MNYLIGLTIGWIVFFPIVYLLSSKMEKDAYAKLDKKND